jgi:hypothetical protein
MRPCPKIKALAAQMAWRHEEDGVHPFLLVLGQATGRVAGVPSRDEIAYQVLDDLLSREDELATSRLSKQDLQDKDKLRRAFTGLLDDMSGGRRYRMLQRVYRHVPIPLGYQNLAVLIKAGYFSTILTTNLHTLLERALNRAGLLQDRHYRVIDLSMHRSDETSSRPLNTTDCPISIVRLLGGAGHRMNAVPEEVAKRVLGLRDGPAGHYSLGDTVMVGYEFERELINHWLESKPGSRSAQLWWVSHEHPDPKEVRPIEEVRDVAYVDGSNADPDTFFGLLAMMLMRLTVETPIEMPEDHAESPPDGASPRSSSSRLSQILHELDDGELERRYFWSQLRRSQTVLYDLEQETPLGETADDLQEQARLQRREIIRVEDNLRDANSVLRLVEEIVESAAASDTDQATLSFMRSLRKAIEEEYTRRDPPNQHVVSAAITALLVLAERLGPGVVVRPELVRELASFAPSVIVKHSSIS